MNKGYQLEKTQQKAYLNMIEGLQNIHLDALDAQKIVLIERRLLLMFWEHISITQKLRTIKTCRIAILKAISAQNAQALCEASPEFRAVLGM